MKKNFFLVVLLCLIAQWSMAQTPKWLDKSRRAVFSVITYDKDDKILSTGNGFFISEDGMALSDYTLFKDARRAVIIDSEGKQLPVVTIQGANSMYDVVKFQVGLNGKKITALPIETTGSAVGATVYLLPYSVQKAAAFTTGKVKEVTSIDGHSYYSLTMKLDDKMVSCPVVNAEGQVIGLAQKASGSEANGQVCYALGASYGKSLSVSALSGNDLSLNSIGIRKGLPETEEQALVYLYMVSAVMQPDEYRAILDEFITVYPNSADGYMRRANNNIYYSTDDATLDKVAADMNRALELSARKDEVYYSYAKLIYGYQLTSPEQTYKDWTYDKALEYTRNAFQIEPLPVYTQLEGDIHFAKRDYDGAFASYEKVNRTNLVSPATYFQAAKAKEMAQGDINEILALMDSCIAQCTKPMVSSEAPYLLERARYYMDAQKYRQAMLDYDAYFNAVKGNVNDAFYYYREQACLYGKQYQRALDDINQAILLSPGDAAYRAELAVINLRVGRYEEAIKAVNETLAIAPDYAEAYRLMGIAQVQLKKNKEACASFAKAKELGDQAVDALIEKHCK